MIFVPVPLASKTSLSTADVAENLRRVTEVIGGDAYNGSTPISYAGSVGRDNLAPLLKVPNSLKSEPYSIVIVQVPIYSLNPGLVTVNGTILPASFGLASALLVGGSFAYSTLVGATSITTTLGITVGSATPFGASVAVTDLAPRVALTFAPTPNPYTFTSSAATRVGVTVGTVTVNGGAGEAVHGQVNLVFKVKHVA
jgi:hypothetical protein